MGAESEDDEEEDDEEEAEGVSFPWSAGGAESFDGMDFSSSLTGFRLVPSPISGVDLEDFTASWVLGFERVPRTDLECEVPTIVAEILYGCAKCSSRVQIGVEFGDVWLRSTKPGEEELMTYQYLGSYIIDI